MGNQITDRGRSVLMAGTGINLALGVLYTWSIFKGAIQQSITDNVPGGFRWDISSVNDPYAVCCLVFAFAMIVAGRCQDRYGPRITSITGGLLVGAGFIWISTTSAYLSWVLGFGVLVGTGIAFGYSSATPAAIKWYPPNKTGRVTGVVVSGFGLASVYIAPLATYLLGRFGLGTSMMIFGVAFMLVVSVLATFLVNPPEGFTPSGFVDRRSGERKASPLFEQTDYTPSQVIRQPAFWAIWTLYFIGAGAGLMIIGSIAGMAKASLGENAFIAVAILAVGNAAGRIMAGIMSDRFGRKPTLALLFGFQAVLMFLAIPITAAQDTNAIMLVLLTTLIGFNYGSNLAIFPSFAKDLWGIKNFGVNYGILFTAWGVGGFAMSRASQVLKAQQGTFSTSLFVAGLLLTAGVVMALLFHDKKDKARRVLKAEAAKEMKNAA